MSDGTVINNDYWFFIGLGISLAIGFLIGLERERHKDERVVVVGIRTFPLTTISGFIISYLQVNYTNMFSGFQFLIPVGIALAGAFAIFIGYVRHTLEMSGFTTSIALFMAFLIGVIIGLATIDPKFMLFGISVGLITTFVLFTKERLSQIVEALTEQELMGALEFMMILFILFPLAYNMPVYTFGSKPFEITMGPGKMIDPYFILLIILFVSIISFISFLIMRRFGSALGVEIAGTLGGLINSEAATVALTDIAKKDKTLIQPVNVGILLANGTMLLRSLGIIVITIYFAGIAGQWLFVLVGTPVIFMLLINTGIALYLQSKLPDKIKHQEIKLEIENPFAIIPAFKFGLVFGTIAAIMFFIQQQVVEGSLFMALFGFFGAGPVVASVSLLVLNQPAFVKVGATIIVIAISFGLINKAILVRNISKEVSKKIFVYNFPAFLIGIISAVVIWSTYFS